MKKNKETITTVIGFLLVLTVSLTLVSGTGVSIPYSTYSPLKLHPGQSTFVRLGLQVGPEESDTSFQATITNDGGGIASFENPDATYYVKNGAKTNVYLNVTIPDNVTLGETLRIEVIFNEIGVSEGGEGSVQFATGLQAAFPVEIVTEGESMKSSGKVEVVSNGGNTWLWIGLILIILIALYFMIRKLKNNQGSP